MNVTTLSEKYQIVIPKTVREQLRLTVGNQVIVQPINDDSAIIIKRPASLTDALSGLGKEMWLELGGADNYVKMERAAWGKEK